MKLGPLEISFRRRPQVLPADFKPGAVISRSDWNTIPNTLNRMDRIPIRQLAKGVTESNIALAATTPILGQYSPAFGWPDDWGLYWEFLDAYLFVPEVAFAVKLKTRLVFKPGYEIVASGEGIRTKIEEGLKLRRILPRIKGAVKNALIFGNAYMEIVDNSTATWRDYPHGPASGYLGGTASGATIAPDLDLLTGYTPGTQFYGLKQIDPRTMRVQIDPQSFDMAEAELRIIRFIQRKWQGPLAPTPSGIFGGTSEIPFHPDQILHLKFNKLPDGIYGYSMMRETLWAIKGLMLMYQYLPAIVQKRADPLLHVRVGGNIYNNGIQTTVIPIDTAQSQDFTNWRSRVASRQPGEDLFTDSLTQVEEIYKARGELGVQTYLQLWKERVFLGLGIPQTMMDILKPGAEVKWGELKFEVLEDEIREYQEEVEWAMNEVILPRLTSQEAEFHFNEITPEDWNAAVTSIIALKDAGIINAEYARQRLDIPEEAGTGAQTKQQPVPPFIKP